MIIRNGVIFQPISELNLNNVTVPTSVNSQRSILYHHRTCQFCWPLQRPHAPLSKLFDLCANTCMSLHLCSWASSTFATSNLPVSSVTCTLLDALDYAKIIHVAIFCYSMKCCRHKDVLASSPPPDSQETIFLCTLQQHMYHLMWFMIKLLKVLDRAKSQLSDKTLYHQVPSCLQNFCYWHISFEKSFRCCWESMWNEISNNWRCRLCFITCLTLVSDRIHVDYMYISHSHVSQPYSQPF